MSITTIIQVLEALAGTVAEAVPLFGEGEDVLSESDATAIHAALVKAEAATAAFRPAVDAALEAAAKA